MRSVATTRQLIFGVAFLSAVGWTTEAHAQFGIGTTWLRTDAQGHYSAVGKMGGKPLGTYNGTVSAEGKTMTVESVVQAGGNAVKIIETWVRK